MMTAFSGTSLGLEMSYGQDSGSCDCRFFDFNQKLSRSKKKVLGRDLAASASGSIRPQDIDRRNSPARLWSTDGIWDVFGTGGQTVSLVRVFGRPIFNLSETSPCEYCFFVYRVPLNIYSNKRRIYAFRLISSQTPAGLSWQRLRKEDHSSSSISHSLVISA